MVAAPGSYKSRSFSNLANASNMYCTLTISVPLNWHCFFSVVKRISTKPKNKTATSSFLVQNGCYYQSSDMKETKGKLCAKPIRNLDVVLFMCWKRRLIFDKSCDVKRKFHFVLIQDLWQPCASSPQSPHSTSEEFFSLIKTILDCDEDFEKKLHSFIKHVDNHHNLSVHHHHPIDTVY